MPSNWMTKRSEIMNLIDVNKLYINGTHEDDLDSSIEKMKANTKDDYYRIQAEANLNGLYNARKELTELLNDAEASQQKTKLKEIGVLQQTIKNSKQTLKKLKDELSVAEAREDAIKNRDQQSSYMQTFGYIFRPFRRLSYTIIVPLIFVMLITAAYVVWSAPASVRMNRSVNMSRASAPPMNNSFNKQMKELFK